MPKILFYPDNRQIEVDKGENLLRAAMLAEVHINAPCGGEGTCGKCRAIVDEGTIEHQPSPKLTQEDINKGYCLACRAVVESNLVVRIPPESRLGERKVLERERATATCGLLLSAKDAREMVKGWQLNPATRKVYLELPPPTLEDNLSDLQRLRRELNRQQGIKDFDIELPLIKKLGSILRASDWQITVTLLNHQGVERLTRIEPGDTSQRNFGIAVDIGTTTVSAQLFDLHSPEPIAQSSDYNAQVSCGEDVISRIVYASKGENLIRLQKLITSTINGLISDLLKKSECSKSDITSMTVAGNTTMTHLFLGLDPKYIREDPYIPTVTLCPLVRAKDLGVEVDEGVYVYVFPGRASYVGGDIVAGVLGSGMYQTDKLTLFIDVGTNGEIVLGNSEWLLACSCSAGPAFEGGTIKHGMRATKGAIEQVRISRDTYEPMILTIGQIRPKGICGSGMIDALAELFLSGIIDNKGRFNLDLKSRRIRQNEQGAEYVLAWAEDTLIGRDLVLTEADIDNLVRTKGAIYAGIITLLESVNLSIADVEQVLIAGAFGHYLEIDKAIVIGLIPEISCENVKFVGNASLLGARLSLLSQEMEQVAEDIAEKMTYLELSVHPSFMDKFVSALFLPHTNIEAFPSVMRALGREDRGTNA